MPGQGAITRATAETLKRRGWTVVYTCIPNTPHINAVPIPTGNGSSRQRYPDIVAFRGARVKFVEVEVRLTISVANDIITRFDEQIGALSDPVSWSSWRTQINRITGHMLPLIFLPTCDLVICSRIGDAGRGLLPTLLGRSISTIYAPDYEDELRSDDTIYAS